MHTHKLISYYFFDQSSNSSQKFSGFVKPNALTNVQSH
jgi:hypothetical protein